MKRITKDDLEVLDKKITDFMREDRDFILKRMSSKIEVDEKTSRRDLVTQLDRENQVKIIEMLKKFLPEAKVLAEESRTSIESEVGLIWVIDPIDGTMNFVKQQEDFAVMIALYEDGQPLLGYIYDIMRDILIHGGVGIQKVYQNEVEIKRPVNEDLKDGLIGLSGPMLVRNLYHFQQIEESSLGARVLGSAGVEFIRVLLGKQVGYISHLKPWDFSAGNALAPVLNLKLSYVDGTSINVLKSGVVLVATKKAYSAIMSMVD